LNRDGILDADIEFGLVSGFGTDKEYTSTYSPKIYRMVPGFTMFTYFKRFSVDGLLNSKKIKVKKGHETQVKIIFLLFRLMLITCISLIIIQIILLTQKIK